MQITSNLISVAAAEFDIGFSGVNISMSGLLFATRTNFWLDGLGFMAYEPLWVIAK